MGNCVNVSELLEELQCERSSEREIEEWSLLHYALLNNSIGAVRQLLVDGVLLDAVIPRQHASLSIFKGDTFLHIAMKFASSAIVELLLDARVNHLAQNYDGFDAFHVSCCFGNALNIKAWVRRFPDYDVSRPSGMAF